MFLSDAEVSGEAPRRKVLKSILSVLTNLLDVTVVLESHSDEDELPVNIAQHYRATPELALTEPVKLSVTEPGARAELAPLRTAQDTPSQISRHSQSLSKL